MSGWLREHPFMAGAILALLYWFFVIFKPSEAYLVDWLVNEKGFTSKQVYQDIFPMWTYSYFLFAILLALVAEIISYKMCIIIGSVAIWMGCFLLLIPTTYSSHSGYLYVMYLDQWCEGLGSASGVIFTSYLFVLIPEAYFLKAVGGRNRILVAHDPSRRATRDLHSFSPRSLLHS